MPTLSSLLEREQVQQKIDQPGFLGDGWNGGNSV